MLLSLAMWTIVMEDYAEMLQECRWRAQPELVDKPAWLLIKFLWLSRGLAGNCLHECALGFFSEPNSH